LLGGVTRWLADATAPLTVRAVHVRVRAAAEVPWLGVAAGTRKHFRRDVLSPQKQKQGGGDISRFGPVIRERIGGRGAGAPRRHYDCAGDVRRARIRSFILVGVEQDRLTDLTEIAGAL